MTITRYDEGREQQVAIQCSGLICAIPERITFREFTVNKSKRLISCFDSCFLIDVHV